MSNGSEKESRFLQNYSKAKNGKGRIQNMDTNAVTDLVKGFASWLGKDRTFTTYSFRRSGASALVKSSISVVGLYHADRWFRMKVAQDYTEHMEYEKTVHVERLDGEKVGSVEKKWKVPIHVHDGEAMMPFIVHGNYRCVN